MIIVLSTTLSVNKAMPTNNPYCTVPLINDAEISDAIAVAMVNNMPAPIKHTSELTQRTIFAPALREAALIRTKMKLRTPKTTARYKQSTAIISINTGAPKVGEPAKPNKEPQLRFKKVFSVKSSNVIFCADELTKGMLSV